ncbi:FK506-binding protein 2A [Tulasnella sp. 424]|nr:FK506-binding protein 2A [Tulasnella sp. 424]KAG8970269.1 FK506-binding protein 2A [Tulasnella sp. 425]
MRSFFTVVLALSASMLASAANPPKKLVIEKTYVPESCPVSSKNGDTLSMHYVGSLFHNNQVFDSTQNRSPYKFKLGSRSAIEGWDLGLKDMCIGEKRKLVIPPDLAYGDKGIRYQIPPMATLIFEVELVAINEKDEKDGNKKEL